MKLIRVSFFALYATSNAFSKSIYEFGNKHIVILTYFSSLITHWEKSYFGKTFSGKQFLLFVNFEKLKLAMDKMFSL